jgi:hypothetical protein
MKKVISNIKKSPLDDSEIRSYLGNVPIISYSKFGEIADIMAEFKKNPVIVFLYETSINRGHWVALHYLDNAIYFFDSYGDPIDSQLLYNTNSENYDLGQNRPYLSMLLNKTPCDVWYNDIKYQAEGGSINTCGRWSILYLLSKKSLREFASTMTKLKKELDLPFDDIVSIIINKTK